MDRIEKGIVASLSHFRQVCQSSSEELRQAIDNRRKNINHVKALERARQNRFSSQRQTVGASLFARFT